MSSLSDKAMLVKLSIGMPGNSKIDKPITQEVKTKYKMGSNACKVSVFMWKPERYDPVKTLAGEIRTWNYANSLTWSDDGWRILPSAAYLDYQAKVREFRATWNQAAENFVAAYDELVAWAQEEHNGAFNPEYYKGPEDLAKKFKFKLEFRPLPSSADFRVQLNQEDMDAIKADIDAGSQSIAEAAVKELGEKLADPIRNMVDKLTTKGKNGKDKRFWDSLVDNITTVTKLVPSLNITGDEVLAKINEEAKELTVHDAQTLRDDKDARDATAKKAEELLAKMQSYFA